MLPTFMGLLSRMLLGAPRTATSIVPVLDLSRLTICGLEGGATQTEIESRLGPASDFAMRRKGQLAYPQIGLQLSLDDRRTLVGFSVFAGPGIFEQYQWEPGRRRRVPDETWFVRTLGEPTTRTSDDEELMLEWKSGTLFVGIDFTLAGALADVLVDYR
jgi:hypothetical protein